MSLARAAIAASWIALAGCGGNDDPAGADAFWKDIHDQKYTSWAHAPGYDTKRASTAPHGDEVIIYVNDVVETALAGGAITSWPEGSLIVKDGFSGGEPDLVAAMEKRADGWYWAEWGAEGDAKFSGTPSTCTDCHASGADSVRAFPFPK